MMDAVSLIYIFMFTCLVVGILSTRYAVRKVKTIDIKRPDLIRVVTIKKGSGENDTRRS